MNGKPSTYMASGIEEKLLKALENEADTDLNDDIKQDKKESDVIKDPIRTS